MLYKVFNKLFCFFQSFLLILKLSVKVGIYSKRKSSLSFLSPGEISIKVSRSVSLVNKDAEFMKKTTF